MNLYPAFHNFYGFAKKNLQSLLYLLIAPFFVNPWCELQQK